MMGIGSASPIGGTSSARDIDCSADFTLSARRGVSATSTIVMSDSFPSLCTVAYATAPTVRMPPTHREPSESHGGDPITTLNGNFDGTLKRERNSSTNKSSKSCGNATLGSRDATLILTIIETESAARRVSRQPILSEADRLAEATFLFGWGFVAQAATNTSGARATALK